MSTESKDIHAIIEEVLSHYDKKFNDFVEQTNNHLSSLQDDINVLQQKLDPEVLNKKNVSLFSSANKKLYDIEIKQIKSKISKAGKILESHANRFLSKDNFRETLNNVDEKLSFLDDIIHELKQKALRTEDIATRFNKQQEVLSERFVDSTKSFEKLIAEFSSKLKELRNELVDHIDNSVDKLTFQEFSTTINQQTTKFEGILNEVIEKISETSQDISEIKTNAVSKQDIDIQIGNAFNSLKSEISQLELQVKDLKENMPRKHDVEETKAVAESTQKAFELFKEDVNNRFEGDAFLDNLKDEIDKLTLQAETIEEKITQKQDEKMKYLHNMVTSQQSKVDDISDSLQLHTKDFNDRFDKNEELVSEVKEQMSDIDELKKHFTERLLQSVPRQNFENSINKLTKNIRELQLSVSSFDQESTKTFENHLSNLAQKAEELRLELNGEIESAQKRDKSIEKLANDIIAIKEAINKIIQHINKK